MPSQEVLSRDGLFLKTCPRCKVEKPLTEFYKRSDRPSGLASHCKACNKIATVKAFRKKKYGISHEQLEEMLAEQDYKCPICGILLDTFCVDHDHASGKVRGLLCNNCNKGLGMFKDNSLYLSKAIIYLEMGM